MNLNIRVVIASVIILLSCYQMNFAQSLSRISSGMDVGTGIKQHEWSPSFLYYQNLSASRARWLQVGWGLRFWGFYRNQESSLVAPSNAPGNDSVTLGKLSANGASFLVGINIKTKHVEFGANADVISLAFGKKRPGLYAIADPSLASDSIAPLHHTDVPVAPRNLNALPWIWKQNNGFGEAYVRIWIHQRVGIKLGYMVGRVAYRSQEKLNNGQKYFGDGYGMPYVAISLPIYN